MRATLGFLILVLVGPILSAVARPDTEEIEALVRENLAASEVLDVDAALATIHPESPAVPGIRQLVDQLSSYEFEMKAVRIEYIGMADEYALVRVVQETRRTAGPDFMDNTTDAIWALRQHEGEWLFWSQMLLRLEPLGRDE